MSNAIADEMTIGFVKRFKPLAIPIVIGMFMMEPEIVLVGGAIIGLILYQQKQQKRKNRTAGESPEWSGGSSSDATSPNQGEILAIGPAPYKHNPSNKESFFIMLRAEEDREVTLWGADLRRVAKQEELSIGDHIALQMLGKRPVRVKDRDGRWINSHRNEWKAEVFSRCYSQ